MRLKITNTTILPKLDYCSAVWDPHLKQDINSLDSVQKFAGRMVTHNWSADISELQETLNWKPLKTCRTNIKLKVVSLYICPSVRACVRAGGHGKPFDPY